jgi:Leucine-rich repeat (LRR) protein
MNPSSSVTIEHLPNEMLVPILKACASPSLFSVCGRWHHLLANEVMPSLYKQIGKVHVPQGDVNEQAFMLDRIYKLEEELSETAKVNDIFKQIFTLASSLSPLGLEFKDEPKEKKYLTLANYSSYLVNINRLLMWKKIPGGEKYLDQEKIKYLPLQKKGELFREWIERYSKDITSLDLTGIGLTFLPTEIGQLGQLQQLCLDDNQLAFLPTEIEQLSQLVVLNLNNNQLTFLPAEIGQLSQLQDLFFSNNQLTSLPAEIGQLSQLQGLDLISNQLISLPAEIGQLSQLQGLDLNNNQLTSLPAEIGQLSQLEVLYLDNNQLTSLPAEIGQLSRLQELYLNSNHLTSLPAEMEQLPALRKLQVKENPLENIPNIIKQRFCL